MTLVEQKITRFFIVKDGDPLGLPIEFKGHLSDERIAEFTAVALSKPGITDVIVDRTTVPVVA